MTTWFFVLSFDYREETEEELVEWIKESGLPHWQDLSGVLSARAFMRSMGMGPRPTFQVWLQIDDLSFLNSWKSDPRTLDAADELFPLIRNFNTAIIKEVT
jgi:hypothetical protein